MARAVFGSGPKRRKRKNPNAYSHPARLLERQSKLERCAYIGAKRACKAAHRKLCEVCAYVERIKAVAKKATRGFYGEQTRVLVCNSYVPGKPRANQLRVSLVEALPGPAERQTIYNKQDGNCLCHGAPRAISELKCLEAQAG